jgi:hypothetical protein
MGTRTEKLYSHVKAWTLDLLPSNPTRRVVLANRYRVASSTDDDYYSRRAISGQMVVDIQQLETFAIGGVVTPGILRDATFLQIPTGFNRENNQVVVSSDNTSLDYSYVDQETPREPGLRSLATRIEGSASAVVIPPLLNASGAAAGISFGSAQDAVRAAQSGIGVSGWPSRVSRALGDLAAPHLARIGRDPGGFAAHMTVLPLGCGLPKVVGTGEVRVWGLRDASKAGLTQLMNPWRPLAARKPRRDREE